MAALFAFRERTVIRTFDPADGNKFVELHRLEGVSLSPTGSQFTLDGDELSIYQPLRVDVDTRARLITTTITVLT